MKLYSSMNTVVPSVVLTFSNPVGKKCLSSTKHNICNAATRHAQRVSPLFIVILAVNIYY